MKYGKKLLLHKVHDLEVFEAFLAANDREGAPVKTPVKTMKFEFPEAHFATAAVVAYLAGVAVVSTGDQMEAIGTGLSLEFFIQPRVDMRVAAYELLVSHDDPYRLKQKIKARNDRICLLQVQHKVCELYPVLRDLEASKQPSAPEVVLRPYHGGHRLGGIVWKPDAYLTREGMQFLGLK